MNRIATAIVAKNAEIKAKLNVGKITQAQIDNTHTALDMDIEEHAMFQNLKSLAVTRNLLTLDEGQTVHVVLGEVVTVFNGQDIGTKCVLTGLFKEMLAARIKERGGKVRR